MKKPLIVIAGPTACGKTAVSIELAKMVSGEIISADSMQVYKYMDIGTAKVTKEEMQGIPHYLVDELEPDEEYSVAVFKNKAKSYLDDIYARNKMPLIVGGTGFYINALVYDNDFMSTQNDYSLREELFEQANKFGNEYLHNKLKEVDPESAKAIHPNNVKRVIRALEYFSTTGKKISEHNKEEKLREPAYDTTFIILSTDRELLYERIEKRVDIMLENGLIDEVRGLLEKYSRDLVSMQGIGYKEIVGYLCGEYSLDEAVDILKKGTRHFAKRQITWFANQCDGNWINVNCFESPKEIANHIFNLIDYNKLGDKI